MNFATDSSFLPAESATADSRPQAPHAVDAEQALLGALMLNNDLFDDLGTSLHHEHFYDKRHQLLFHTLQTLRLSKHADPVMVVQHLSANGKLREAGGEEYIANLADIGAASVNVPVYAELICHQALLRRMIQTLAECASEAHRPGDKPPAQLLDEIESKLAAVGQQFAESRENMRLVKEDAGAYCQNMINIINTGNFDALRGAPSGFPKLDKLTAGLHGGDLVIVAGRPGSGKTAFVLNLVRHVSATEGGVAMFSLEMSSKLLAMRLISQEGLDMRKLRTGKDSEGRAMSSDDLRALSSAVSVLEDRHIYIDDSGMLNILEARARARRVRRLLARDDKKLALVVVDYLQLMGAGGTSAMDNRAIEVSAVSRGLKALAKELDVPVVAAAQLNRSVDMRPQNEPMLSDLRESGAIEQDADLVLFLHKKSNELTGEENTPVKLIIGKQRNGPVGWVDLVFQKNFTRFVQDAEESGSF